MQLPTLGWLCAFAFVAASGGGLACSGGGGDSSETPLDGPKADADLADAAADACKDRLVCPDARVLLQADIGGGPERDMAAGLVPARDVDTPFKCSDLYSQAILPTFEVEMDEVEWAKIQDEFAHPVERESAGLPPKPYHPLRVFRFGHDEVFDAFIRLKGNQHFSWRPPKMQFVVSFREVNKEGRFHGLRKINLDAPFYDTTMLNERLALSVMREAGQAAGCANNARLLVNGVYYGLYINKEHIDREFLERNFDDPDGDLYKYGHELKTNDDTADTSLRDAFWAAPDLQTLDALIDRDQVLKSWAGEALLPVWDGYYSASHNFYTYRHPSRGFMFVLHDLDISFDGHPEFINASPQTDVIATGSAPFFVMAMANREWREQFARHVADMVQFMEPDEMERRLDYWSAQIAGAVATDPNLPWERANHARDVAALRAFLRPRYDYLVQFADNYGRCERGLPGRDRDRDGSDECLDCNDLNQNVKPGGSETCNGADDDCNGAIDDGLTCGDCVELVVNGGRHMLCPGAQTWFDAAGNCQRMGGNLAVPVDEDARTQLGQLATTMSMEPWWLGANDGDNEGAWADPNGHPIEAPPWAPGKPNGDDDQNCAVFEVADGSFLWNDDDCTTPYPAICQLP